MKNNSIKRLVVQINLKTIPYYFNKIIESENRTCSWHILRFKKQYIPVSLHERNCRIKSNRVTSLSLKAKKKIENFMTSAFFETIAAERNFPDKESV